MNTFFFHLTHPPSLLDPDHFRFEKGAAVPLLTAKLAVEDKMFALEERIRDAAFLCDSKRHIAVTLQPLKGPPVFYTQ